MPDKSLSFRADGQLSLEALRGFMPTVEIFWDGNRRSTFDRLHRQSRFRLDFLVMMHPSRLDFFPHPLEHISSKMEMFRADIPSSLSANLEGSYDMRGFVSLPQYPKM